MGALPDLGTFAVKSASMQSRIKSMIFLYLSFDAKGRSRQDRDRSRHSLRHALIVLLLCFAGRAPADAQATRAPAPLEHEIPPFPEVKDLKSVVISLSRYGSSLKFEFDSYDLKIAGDGIVEYNGLFGYVTGPHRCHITDEEVRKLVEAFQEADFYQLEDESQLSVRDATTTEISLAIGGRTRTVVNELGNSQKFNQLVAKIDELSHAEQWRTGNAETVPGLLADGENLNVPDDDGRTVLMWACQRTDATVVREFLRAGANLRTKDQYGRTALMYAAARGLPEILDVLLQAGADPREPDRGGETPLIYAAGIGKVFSGREFYRKSLPTYYSWFGPSDNLVGDPSAQVIQMLLHAGADPNASDSEGATALMYAAVSFKDNTDILHVLMDGGANINQQDSGGRTALMRAADSYLVDSVRFLIKAKADVNLRDGKGRTALGRLHPSRDKLFRHDPAYKQIRLLLKQAEAAR